MSGSSLAALVLVAGLAAACGDPPEPDVVLRSPATLAELAGAWSARPLLLDPVLRSRIAETCARDMEMGPGATALLIDVRGAGVATLRMSRGSCDALKIDPDGSIHGAGGGASGMEQGRALANDALGQVEQHMVIGGDLTVEGWSAIGRVGPDISLVVVQPVDHVAVVATLENGWFGAWWPARPFEPPRDGRRFPPAIVRAYNALGVLVNEVRI